MTFTEVPIVGTYLRATGGPAAGTVSFTLNAQLRNGVVTAPGRVSVTLVGGEIPDGTTLAAVDDDGTTPTGASYHVVEHLDGVSTAWDLVVSVEDDEIDLGTVDHAVATPPGVIVYAPLGADGTVPSGYLPAVYQPLDADLTGLAALGNGNPVRTGGTWSARSDAALATALGVSGGGAAGVTPEQLLGLRSDPIKWLKNERITAPTSGATATVHDVDGAGTVEALWFAFSGDADTARDYILRVYVDGEAAPAVETDIGTLFLAHGAPSTPGYEFTGGTQHLTSLLNSDTATFGGAVRFPMPFSDGLTVTLTHVGANEAVLYWSQLVYREVADPADVPTYRLRSKGATWVDRHTTAQGDAHDLLDLANGEAGWLVWHGVCGVGATALSWLERNVQISVDGEVTPSIESSGFEDWFFGAHYFLDVPYGRPEAMCTMQKDNAANAGVDLLEAVGGIPFSDGIKIRLGTEELVNTAYDQSFLLLFYITSGPLAVEVPDAPTIGAATGFDQQASVAFTPPASNGGSAITGYTATSTPGGITGTGSGSPLVVTGLTNGVEYTFTVHATNAVGNSAESTASNAVTPATAEAVNLANITGATVVAIPATNDSVGSSDDLNILRDGVTPTVGASSQGQQYDSFNLTNEHDATAENAYGYTFTEPHTFTKLVFQEGHEFADGGWFTTLRVEVRQSGTWTAVSGLSSSPTYPLAQNFTNFDTYEFTFTPAVGTGIRVIGNAGGSANFTSCAELTPWGTP